MRAFRSHPRRGGLSFGESLGEPGAHPLRQRKQRKERKKGTRGTREKSFHQIVIEAPRESHSDRVHRSRDNRAQFLASLLSSGFTPPSSPFLPHPPPLPFALPVLPQPQDSSSRGPEVKG